MKKLLFCMMILVPLLHFAQKGYPTPPDAQNRLFYIQHSNNHNTFVYDANVMPGHKLKTGDPIDVYRLTYAKDGRKEALTAMQRKMAYGVTLSSSSASSCEFTLAAYPSKKLLLNLGKDGRPYVTTNINGKNIILNRMYLQMGKLGTNVLHIDFYGKDVSGKEITERLYIK